MDSGDSNMLARNLAHVSIWLKVDACDVGLGWRLYLIFIQFSLVFIDVDSWVKHDVEDAGVLLSVNPIGLHNISYILGNQGVDDHLIKGLHCNIFVLFVENQSLWVFEFGVIDSDLQEWLMLTD